MAGGAVTTTLWTSAASSSLRRGGVFSSAVAKKRMDVLELMLLVLRGWQRDGVSGEPYSVCGLTVADLVLLLADGDRSCGI